ncbi:hypothetical protein QM480_17195 [Flectobacillus sp. DC10W]|uniref:Uncharacterized protein n=1 Tax=Flectobacillus longus TaxID=2984207 RepID=A0ABT6YSG6_9BACT|nr:hypothetical protein [Flectobacillus longus]MDI9866081.1 hypothetical protein [Flectobacillus longus]
MANEKKDLENSSKRYNIACPDWLMDKIRIRSTSLGMSVSGYLRYLAIKDLEAFEQSQGKQS